MKFYDAVMFKSCLTSTLHCVFLHKGMTSNMRCLCCVRTMLYIGLLLLAMELTFTDTNMPRILQISADTNIANKFVTFIILFSITGGLHHEGDWGCVYGRRGPRKGRLITLWTLKGSRSGIIWQGKKNLEIVKEFEACFQYCYVHLCWIGWCLTVVGSSKTTVFWYHWIYSLLYCISLLTTLWLILYLFPGIQYMFFNDLIDL